MFSQFKFVDLTQPLTKTAPTWNGSCGFCIELKKDYDRIFRVQQLKMHAGVGTHMDAPSHRFPNGISIGEIPLEQLIVPLCILDVSHKVNADYEISAQDIKIYEKTHGIIDPHSFVIGFTGWSRYWTDAIQYRNLDSEGRMHFPAFSEESAELLLKRDVVGLGIDTLSPDCANQEYPVHRLILGAGKYITENIGDCSQIPPKGAYVISLPLRAEGCTECPIRIIALCLKSPKDS